ncbi:MAG: PilZ domain-containing protein [Polyangiaceae bacterium]
MVLAFDRRATRRSVLVDCEVVREEGFRLLGVRAVDLSPRGMLLSSNRSATVGEELIVTLRVPGTRVWIDTLATVVRVVHGRRAGDRGPAIALTWAPLPTEEDRLLRSALGVFPPILPARTPRVDYAATAALIALA